MKAVRHPRTVEPGAEADYVASDAVDVLQQRAQGRLDAAQLLEVRAGQRLHPIVTERSEPNPDGALIVRIGVAGNQPDRLGPVDQTHRAVVAHQQIAGYIGDGRPGRIGMPAHRDEQLMLRRRHADRLGRLLAPGQEATQRHTERQQLSELPIRQRSRPAHPSSLARPRWRHANLPIGLR